VKISHLGHSTVLVEAGSTRLLIDPGNYSQTWHDLTGLDAILVTHAHPDHVDPEWVPQLRRNNPAARWLVEPGVTQVAGLAGAEVCAPGSSQRAGTLTVEAVGGRHAVIHRDIPRIGNVGFVITEAGGGRFFHPGDALDTVPDGVGLLAIPAHAPWCAMKETIDFVRAVGAPKGFLIHDGLINERGWALTFARLNEMTGTAVLDVRGASVEW